jgi:nitrogen fixation/metabolism regulation signal transduction histidine kinase
MLATIVGPAGLLLLVVFFGLPIWALVDARRHGASGVRLAVSAVLLLAFYPVGVALAIGTWYLARKSPQQLNP